MIYSLEDCSVSNHGVLDDYGQNLFQTSRFMIVQISLQDKGMLSVVEDESFMAFLFGHSVSLIINKESAMRRNPAEIHWVPLIIIVCMRIVISRRGSDLILFSQKFNAYKTLYESTKNKMLKNATGKTPKLTCNKWYQTCSVFFLITSVGSAQRITLQTQHGDFLHRTLVVLVKC